MRRTLFSSVIIKFNGITYGEINSKNFAKYFLMYRLNHVTKKKKLRAQDIIQQIKRVEVSDTRNELAKFIINFAKLQREADAFEFLDARHGGETMSDRIMSTITGNVEATLSFDAYIKAGMAIISSYTNKVKEIAFNIVDEYGKARAHYLSKEELSCFLHSKVRNESIWRIEAFME